jgi:small-conductance mechanosensitive channel
VNAGNLRETLSHSMETLAAEAVARLPGLIVAVLLVVAGWIIARICRSATQRLMDSVQKSIARRSGRPEPDTGAERVSARVLSIVVFWAVILLFAATATQIIGLELFTKWMSGIVRHLPGVAAGLIIIAAGFVASGFVGDLVRSGTRRVQWVAVLAAVVLAVTLGGAALAVSLGSKRFVANAIGAHYMRQSFRVGERVRVVGYEGRIIDINAASIVLETDSGRVNIPAGVYSSAPIELLSDERSESV